MTARPLEFPRKLRLLKSAEFRAVYQRGKRAASGSLRARMAGNGLDHGRLGMAVGVKAAGGAVARNRLRRQVRESFRRHQHHLAGLDIVVSVPRISGEGERGIRRALPKLWGAVKRGQATRSASPNPR